MRLHRLRLSAFQAFAGTEEVDFDSLTAGGLFLLHGDTGAGKTTLLDAVAFALYGELPGARARDARIRSDHAAPDVRTEVELEVTLRDRRIRIVRRPAQERPKLRGEGTTTEPHSCTVRELDPSGEWVVLASRVDEARDELDRLLGMTCDQFCQVVLLPQGEFATFLRADSSERQEVLERLFGTDRFARVEQWLNDRRRDATGELGVALQTVRDVVTRISEVAGEPAPDDWERDVEALPSWAGGLAAHADASLATADATRKAAAVERTAAERALADGRALADEQARHARAVEELRAWSQRQPAREAAEAELAAAERAAPLAALLESAPEAATVADLAQQAARAVPAAPAASDEDALDEPTAPASTDSSSAALREQAAALRGEAGALDALLAVEQRLARDVQELGRLSEEADRAAAHAREAHASLELATRQREALDATIRKAREAAARVEQLEAAAADARQRAERAVERDRLRERRERATETLRKAVDAEQDAREAWLELRELRLAGMAAELAAGLVPGEPCAVCGSTDHPAPAHVAAAEHGAEPVTQERSATSSDADDSTRAALPAAAQDADRSTSHPGATLRERERQAEAAHRAAADDRARAERELADVEARLAAAVAIAGDGAADELEREAARLAEQLADARAEAAAGADADARLRAIEQRIREQRQAHEDATRAVAAARATITERTRALEADRTRVAEARGSFASVAARAEALRAQAAAAEVEAAAREAGFDSAAAARAALRDDQARAELRDRIERFDTGLAERRALADDPELKAAAAQPAPDLPALKARASAAAEADAEATRRHGLATERLTALERLTRELATALDELEPVAERERTIRELAGLVDGTSVANRQRMRLSAYVLAARLEEVAAAASARLERMSHGRYQLVHTDERRSGRGRSGLELRVVDGWTGRQRPPATLSGGETFLASLALALGLADVVAAESGGSRLETLFIDEGFGTLDERTLDEVLDVLDGLREGGRAVGIVSHVPELRQRIPARLRVVKGRAGSRVEHERSPAAA